MESSRNAYYFHKKRDRVDSVFFDLYRCFDANYRPRFSAHAKQFGKPVPIYDCENESQVIAEIRNRKGYLVNGRTDFHDLRSGCLVGSYSRFSRVYDADDNKTGAWRDARSWSEEFKINLVDALANLMLGSGDVPAGANPGDTHLLTKGKTVLVVLQRERLPFFPDPPRRTEPGKLARFASRIVPGELGKSLAEVTPPSGWKLTIQSEHGNEQHVNLLLYCALYRLEFLRWSRSA